MRKIRREGIELFHSFYWHGALAGLVTGHAGKLPVKYHPLNLSSIYLELPDGGHLAVPLRDRRRPSITKFEHDLAMKTLRERGRRGVDEQSLFGMIDTQRRLVLETIDKTKAARRSAQRVAYALDGGSPTDLPGPPAEPVGIAEARRYRTHHPPADRGAIMTGLYDHLFAAYREQADLPDEARIDWLRRDRWVSLPQSEAALRRLEDLLTYPPRGRMPCLLLTGRRAWGRARY